MSHLTSFLMDFVALIKFHSKVDRNFKLSLQTFKQSVLKKTQFPLRQFSAVRSKTLNFIIDKLLVTAAMI
jgi:hypothetical protein